MVPMNWGAQVWLPINARKSNFSARRAAFVFLKGGIVMVHQIAKTILTSPVLVDQLIAPPTTSNATTKNVSTKASSATAKTTAGTAQTSPPSMVVEHPWHPLVHPANGNVQPWRVFVSTLTKSVMAKSTVQTAMTRATVVTMLTVITMDAPIRVFKLPMEPFVLVPKAKF